MRAEDLAAVLLEHRKWIANHAEGSQALLSTLEISMANQRGAGIGVTDLHRAPGCIRLDMIDPRHHEPVAEPTLSGWIIHSGCRRLIIAEALEHWGENYAGHRDIGDRYLRAIGDLPECRVVIEVKE